MSKQPPPTSGVHLSPGLPMPEGAVMLSVLEAQFLYAWHQEVETAQKRINEALGIMRASTRMIGVRATGVDGEYGISPDFKFITKRE